MKNYIIFIIVSLNIRMSQTTKQTPFEIVFGQRPNTLERFDVGNGEHVLDEENVEELLSGNDDECVALYVYMLNMSPPTSLAT